jgi:hypothetical protein
MFLPKKTNGSESKAQNAEFAIIDFITSGDVFSPFAAFSAVNGNMVKSSVAERKFAISEKREAI